MKTKYGLRPVIRLKEILDGLGLTQKELAEMIGETPQQINKWVNGVEPCISALGRIALTLGVTLCDLAWLAGDDESFDHSNVVYIRGQIVRGIFESGEDPLSVLKQHYRWTEEELAGVKVASKSSKRNEITLACVGKNDSEAFITWAKKDRDDMYRL